MGVFVIRGTWYVVISTQSMRLLKSRSACLATVFAFSSLLFFF